MLSWRAMAHTGFHEAVEEHFGNRYKAHPPHGGEADAPMAAISPANIEEVEFLAELAGRYSVPLIPEGALTAPKLRKPPEAVTVRFDLMREVSAPQPPDFLVKVQPGIPWLQLEDHLRNYERSLPIYPTSGPRATVGGWLALNGLGIGSFEYGWLWENVALVDFVPRGGGLRTVPGDELPLVLKPGYTQGLVVSATLWTTRLETYTPFSAAFDAPEDLAQAMLGIYRAGVPLWHLGLQNAAMAQARGHEGKHLLFGAYPEERAPKVEEPLWRQIEPHRGRRLPLTEAYRVWGTRFFPVSPSTKTPTPSGMLVSVEQLTPALRKYENVPETSALQGSISRSGEAVLLAVDLRHE